MRAIGFIAGCLFALLVPDQSIADPVSETQYDGLYLETKSGEISRLDFITGDFSQERMAYYLFEQGAVPNCEIAPDYSGMESHITALYKGKSFFKVRADYFREVLKSAKVADRSDLKSFYTKGSDLEILSVNMLYFYDQFLGANGFQYFIPRNITLSDGLTGKRPCDFYPQTSDNPPYDSVIMSAEFGWSVNNQLLRASLSHDLVRYDLKDPSWFKFFDQQPFQLAAWNFDIKTGLGIPRQSANVPFDACSRNCRLAGFVIETSLGASVIIDEDVLLE